MAYPQGDRQKDQFDASHFGQSELNVREALVKLPVDVPLVLIRAPIAENTGL